MGEGGALCGVVFSCATPPSPRSSEHTSSPSKTTTSSNKTKQPITKPNNKPNENKTNKGHEDHIGALPWVIPALDPSVPIYGGGFVLQLVARRLQEFNLYEPSR
jgi:hypothetical protein